MPVMLRDPASSCSGLIQAPLSKRLPGDVGTSRSAPSDHRSLRDSSHCSNEAEMTITANALTRGRRRRSRSSDHSGRGSGEAGSTAWLTGARRRSAAVGSSTRRGRRWCRAAELVAGDALPDLGHHLVGECDQVPLVDRDQRLRQRRRDARRIRRGRVDHHELDLRSEGVGPLDPR
jgi:hypothetical protein